MRRYDLLCGVATTGALLLLASGGVLASPGTPAPENSLMGVALMANYRAVLHKFGQPQEIQVGGGNGARIGGMAGGMAGGPPGFPGAPGGMRGMMPGMAGGGPPAGLPGFPGGPGGMAGGKFGMMGAPGGMRGMMPGMAGGGPPGMPGGMRGMMPGGGPPGAPGGYPGAAGGKFGMMAGGAPGGMPGMAGGKGEGAAGGLPGFPGAPGGMQGMMPGMGGSALGGGNTNAAQGADQQETTWWYHFPQKGLHVSFLFNHEGRVIQIQEYGWKGGSATRQGIGLGSSLGQLLHRYGWSNDGEHANLSGHEMVTMRYGGKHKVAFQLVDNKVVGITLGAVH